MDAAQTIRDCIADVTALRLHRTGDPALGAAVGRVKTLQAQRFRGTYADLMASPAFGPAARFFLEELYGDTKIAGFAGIREHAEIELEVNIGSAGVVEADVVAHHT